MINIITWGSKCSKPVEKIENISGIVDEMREFASHGPFPGNFKNSVAIHHSQVSSDPYNFFAVNKEFEKLFDGEGLIINPEVVNGSVPYESMEGCMSFGFRKPKKVKRMNQIHVKYQVLSRGLFGAQLKKVEKDLTELAAAVFQHETDHAKGKTIYD